MASIDEPDRISFQRAGQEKAPAALAKWTDVLRGKLHLLYMAEVGLTNAIANIAKYWQRKGFAGTSDGKLKPGITRKGKPLDAVDQSSGTDNPAGHRKSTR